ncbi:uncharacterized protein BDZ99DRAFT_478850 [Mytilinidion resinicola]|uniref:Uncharacterized protein n=1 Tax=Mytilinidion resinicola TaxID=574789 RepID=A0A6A6YFQ5_9PEZI|nr:uncharacterized protein BDZ99DRAFT_478850 [Mytilinidion resinicola]KAF2807363.1 hypothetical protein BDZ99DRAFT_478850 [Mytilinidion resinicola]
MECCCIIAKFGFTASSTYFVAAHCCRHMHILAVAVDGAAFVEEVFRGGGHGVHAYIADIEDEGAVEALFASRGLKLPVVIAREPMVEISRSENSRRARWAGFWTVVDAKEEDEDVGEKKVDRCQQLRSLHSSPGMALIEISKDVGVWPSASNKVVDALSSFAVTSL